MELAILLSLIILAMLSGFLLERRQTRNRRREEEIALRRGETAIEAKRSEYLRQNPGFQQDLRASLAGRELPKIKTYPIVQVDSVPSSDPAAHSDPTQRNS